MVLRDIQESVVIIQDCFLNATRSCIIIALNNYVTVNFVKRKTFLPLIPQLNLRCYFFHSLVGLNKLFLDIYPLKVKVSFLKSTPYYIFVFRLSVGDSFSEFLIYK